MPRIWFTSDTHLGHTNIIDYCRRPFTKSVELCQLCHGSGERNLGRQGMMPCTHPDVEAMDRTIIERWNDTVAPDDEVWHLGDFAFGSVPQVRRYVERLHGRKALVMGNHDRHRVRVYESMGFLVRREPHRLGHLVLSHHPPWPVASGQVYLCGHIHGLWKTKQYGFMMPKPARLFNVGVDVHDFRPVQLKDLGLDEGLLP